MTQGGSQSVMSNYPGLYISSIVALAASIYCLYLAFKSRNFSIVSWNLSLGSLIAMPVLIYPVCNLLALPLLRQNALLNNTSVSYLLPGLDLVYIAIGIFILWRAKTYHNQIETGTSNTIKMILLIISIIAFVIFGMEGVSLTSSQKDRETNYLQISEQANQKIYKLQKLPDDLVYVTDYEIKPVNGKADEIRIGLGTPISKMTKDNNKVIVISQEKIVEGYDITTDFKDSDPNIEKVAVPVASGQIAYLGFKKFGDGRLYNLEFATDDGILIKIMSPNTDPQILIDLSQQLE